MNLLQITHDWKWTGPAEPMLRLGLALRERGHTVYLACPEAQGEARSLASEACQGGMTPDLILERAKGVRLFSDGEDIRCLTEFLRKHEIQVVHTWHTRDHVLVLRALRNLPAARRPVVIRSYRVGEAIPAWPWNRFLFGAGCDGLLCVSPRVAAENQKLRGGRPTAGAFGAVDFDRFSPKAADPAVRESLGLDRAHRVVGIVARMQPHRRFDLLLNAAKILFEKDPMARLLVIGRGTHAEEVAMEPARRLGIEDRVIFAGYIQNNFEEVLRSMDLLTFLVPGSDGTCRAVLEAAACGIPAVTTRRGALPEIVLDGETGLCVNEDPVELAEAWSRLLEDEALRVQLGRAAARRAQEHFTPQHLADQAEALYRQALGEGFEE
ncbi:MAG: glycosyltransferase family 4 protein [Deltaproteobacteria bacterium]|nr:glycosyltransferase family 4 protein [Deltaproteobacteria bacterium]